MKKILLMMLALVSMTAVSQKKDVTTFLGIPVDGTKEKMMRKLIDKGFSYVDDDKLYGEFNGEKAFLAFKTNKNKVWGVVVVFDRSSSEQEVKDRFNDLCRQFAKNQRYTAAYYFDKNEYILPDSVNVSRKVKDDGIRTNISATYLQDVDWSRIDTLELRDRVAKMFSRVLTKEEFENPNEKQKKAIEITTSYVRAEMLDEMKIQKAVSVEIMKDPFEFGKYSIVIYYENKYNKANGEDL